MVCESLYEGVDFPITPLDEKNMEGTSLSFIAGVLACQEKILSVSTKAHLSMQSRVWLLYPVSHALLVQVSILAL